MKLNTNKRCYVEKYLALLGKENGITTGLAPGERFTFIVYEQDCFHTFED
jgi:hypothetical protein